jgi:hypothetical protein
MVGLRALNHIAHPSSARGYMQHPYAHSLPFFWSFHRLLLLRRLPYLLGSSSLALPGAVLRSCETFSFFSILLCLAAWTCLLLGFFLPCHLGLFGSSLPFLRKGLPESLRICCCSLQSSYLEPTVPPLARRLSVSTSGKEPAALTLIGAMISRAPAASSCVSQTRLPLPCVNVLMAPFLLNLRDPSLQVPVSFCPCPFSSGCAH